MCQSNVTLLFQFLRYKDIDVVIAEEERRIKAMSSIAFDLIRIILDKSLEHTAILVQNLEFVRTLSKCIYKQERKVFDKEEV